MVVENNGRKGFSVEGMRHNKSRVMEKWGGGCEIRVRRI
jgi:hypothetical protein